MSIPQHKKLLATAASGTPPKVVVILGPTSSGKSDLAVFLAKKYNGEIISADSRQVYKWMNIGTGKVPLSYKPRGANQPYFHDRENRVDKKYTKFYKNIPHHMLDIAHPSRQFTVVQYQKKALKIIHDIQRRGKLPILVGGTGLYIQAVVDGTVFPEVGPNRMLRSKLRNMSADVLFQKLQKLDPRRALSIESKNKRRLIRALEIVAALGKVPRIMNTEPASTSESEARHQPVRGEAGQRTPHQNKFGAGQATNNILILGIEVPREKLNKRIKLRLKNRLRQGMVAEVKNLREKHRVSWNRLENLGLEYRWIARYLQHKIARAEMEEKLYRDIKNYAKRQITWFKRDKRVHWIKGEQEAKILVQKFTQQE